MFSRATPVFTSWELDLVRIIINWDANKRAELSEKKKENKNNAELTPITFKSYLDYLLHNQNKYVYKKDRH